MRCSVVLQIFTLSNLRIKNHKHPVLLSQNRAYKKLLVLFRTYLKQLLRRVASCIFIIGTQLQQWLLHYSLTCSYINTRGSWHLLVIQRSKSRQHDIFLIGFQARLIAKHVLASVHALCCMWFSCFERKPV